MLPVLMKGNEISLNEVGKIFFGQKFVHLQPPQKLVLVPGTIYVKIFFYFRNRFFSLRLKYKTFYTFIGEHQQSYCLSLAIKFLFYYFYYLPFSFTGIFISILVNNTAFLSCNQSKSMPVSVLFHFFSLLLNIQYSIFVVFIRFLGIHLGYGFTLWCSPKLCLLPFAFFCFAFISLIIIVHSYFTFKLHN